MKALLGIAALVVVVVVVIQAKNKGFLGEAKNRDISNTRWTVSIANLRDHELEVGPISSANEVTVKRVMSGTSRSATGTYLAGKLTFTLSNGRLESTVTATVARDGKTMSGTIATTAPTGNTQQEFTAVRK